MHASADCVACRSVSEALFDGAGVAFANDVPTVLIHAKQIVSLWCRWHSTAAVSVNICNSRTRAAQRRGGSFIDRAATATSYRIKSTLCCHLNLVRSVGRLRLRLCRLLALLHLHLASPLLTVAAFQRTDQPVLFHQSVRLLHLRL